MNNKAVSPNGELQAICQDYRNTIEIWHVKTETRLFALEAYSNIFHYLCFSPDSSLLVSWTYNNIIEVWSTESGVKVYSISKYMRANGRELSVIGDIAISPDNRLLAIKIAEYGVDLYNLRKDTSSFFRGRNTYFKLEDDACSIGFWADNKQVKRWKIDNGEEIPVVVSNELKYTILSVFEQNELLNLAQKANSAWQKALENTEQQERYERFEPNPIAGDLGIVSAFKQIYYLTKEAYVQRKMRSKIAELKLRHNYTRLDYSSFPDVIRKYIE